MQTNASKSDLSASRDDVGASWAASWAILGSLEMSWERPEGYWWVLGELWRGLGVVLEGFGALLGRSWEVLGGLGAILGGLGVVLGGLGDVLKRSWIELGALLV